MAESDRERWDRKWSDRGGPIAEPSRFVLDATQGLPPGARVLDVAGGAGRHALPLAQRGFDVTVIDVSPVGLAQATAAAHRAGTELRTHVVDLEAGAIDGEAFGAPFDAVVCVHFMDRGLYPQLSGWLVEGGRLVIEHPTRRNLERHEKPGGRWLLEEGELLRLVAGVQVVGITEDWTETGRHEARLVALRPSTGP